MLPAEPFIKRKAFWLKDALHGMVMWREYRDVSRIMMDPAGAESLRKARLADIIAYAKENTEFYSSVSGSELADFPVINKHIIRSGYSAFLVPAERIPGQRGPLRTNVTSGSTGTPFRSMQDSASRIRRIATLKACNEQFGFHSCMPMLYLHSCEIPDSNDSMFRYEKEQNIWSASVPAFDDETLGRIAGHIAGHRIKFVRGYLSIIEYLIDYIDRKGIELKSEPLFITIGEKLNDSLRSRIVDKMGFHVVSQYGNEENGVFGQSETDESGDLIRLNKANCIIELLRIDSDEPAPAGEPGRVIVTDLTNRAMPMIRYDIGDLAICREVLPSGEPLVLQLLECRKEDMVYDTSGNPVPMVFPYDIWSIPSLRQVQFIQEDIRKYTLILNVGDTGKNLDQDNLTGIVRGIMGPDAEVGIRLVSDIPVICSGKRKVVIQNCKRYL